MCNSPDESNYDCLVLKLEPCLLLTSRWQHPSMNIHHPPWLNLLFWGCDCCYAANIHHIIHSDSILLQPSEEPPSFLKLLFVLKTEPHELVKTGASQRGAKDERLKTRRMKRMNKVRMRRGLSYSNIRRTGVLSIQRCVLLINSSHLLS